MIDLTLKRLLTLRAASSPHRNPFLSAASGLVRVGDRYFVVADDELHLGVFPVTGVAAGKLERLFPGDLPRPAKPRKRAKPDLEALVALPGARGKILAIPSGSRDNRQRGALIALATGRRGEPVQVVDFTPLYATLADEIPGRLNIEGACVTQGRLILAQRGNSKKARSALISLDLSAVVRGLRQRLEIDAKALRSIKEYDLGELDEVRLAFTDVAALGDGTVFFAATAEATDDAFDDAPFTGSVVGRIAASGKLGKIQRLSACIKAEGLHVARRKQGILVTLVTDADDPECPAGLFQGIWRL